MNRQISTVPSSGYSVMSSSPRPLICQLWRPQPSSPDSLQPEVASPDGARRDRVGVIGRSVAGSGSVSPAAARHAELHDVGDVDGAVRERRPGAVLEQDLVAGVQPREVHDDVVALAGPDGELADAVTGACEQPELRPDHRERQRAARRRAATSV